MSDTVIKVENLSKKFIIGHQSNERYTALRDVIVNNVKGAIRKTRELIKGDSMVEGIAEEFWALRDVNFEVKQGDRIGIIGRNGAGKSTLLKVLSRITEPTAGRIILNGRIASLLEVGTGFHPELTGRENIFLNGAILGMGRSEIRKKFDEIVAFAEVEKFLDTPVKRYSSGMYVRLAFAVAAHLEPEILIVDEVLAVGDAHFQKKCLGKMQDVSTNEGRTVLFVSHNMSAIQALCNKGILLNDGKKITDGEIDNVVDEYLSYSVDTTTEKNWDNLIAAPGNENVKLKSLSIKAADGRKNFDVRTALQFEVKFWNLQDNVRLNLSFHLNKLDGNTIFNIGTQVITCDQNMYKGFFTIPGNFLNNGHYSITLMIVKDASQEYADFENCLNFEVEDYREGAAWFGNWKGAVRPTFIQFTIEKND